MRTTSTISRSRKTTSRTSRGSEGKGIVVDERKERCQAKIHVKISHSPNSSRVLPGWGDGADPQVRGRVKGIYPIDEDAHDGLIILIPPVLPTPVMPAGDPPDLQVGQNSWVGMGAQNAIEELWPSRGVRATDLPPYSLIRSQLSESST